MEILQKIKNFFKDNKKIFYYFWFFIIIYLMAGEVSFATQNTATTATAGAATWKEQIIEIVNSWIQVLALLVAALTYFITLFLDPGWINWTLFWLGEIFRTIWTLVSNIVYIIFAFILIWIAFMNIIGKSDNKWELKQTLPKFIIWVLIVPFTWFFVQFVLSISSILTMQVLTLPSDIIDGYEWILTEVKVKKNCVLNLSADTTINEKYFDCKWEEVSLIDSMDNTSFWLISTYTYWILKIEQITEIVNEQFTTENIKTMTDLIIKIVFDLLFILVYMILIVTLGLVLIVRWFYIWIYIMLSPAFGLMYFFDKKDWWWEWVLSKFKIWEFISLAFIPVYVMLALTFWLLFIHTVTTWINWYTEEHSSEKVSISSQEGDIINDTITLWNFSLSIKWAVWSANTDESSTISQITTWWKWVLWTIWSMILYIMWIWVFRISIMAALRTSDITKAVVEPIYQFGNQVWQLVAKSPQYAPVFGGVSGQEIQSSWSAFKSTVESHYSTKWSNMWQEFAKSFWFWDEDMMKLQRMSVKSFARWKDTEEWIRELLKNINESKLKNSSYREAIWEVLSRLWASDELINKVKQKWNNKQELAKILEENHLWWAEGVKIFGGPNNIWIEKMIWWGNSSIEGKSVVWDMTSNSVTKEEWNENSDLKNKKIVVKRDGDQSIIGKWTIYIKNDNWDWWEMYNVKFTSLSENDKDLTWVSGDDTKELLKLYWEVKEEWMKKILKELWFSTNVDSLVSSIKSKYEEK